jgi:lysophospholipid acyltransferase (LPLAT)-like uncharacterized protein
MGSATQPRYPWWIGLAARGLNGLVSLLRFTCRDRVGAGAEQLERIIEGGRPVIFAFWHGRLVFCALVLAKVIRGGRPVTLLTSLSRDGELAARMAGARGYELARGSSSRGGLTSLRQLHRKIRGGSCVATAPDGPRGPAGVVQPGTLMLAKLADVPIVPVAFAASRAWRLRSWDRLVLPKPFSRVVATIGEPMAVTKDISHEGLAAAAKELERRLNELVSQAESLL